MKAVLNSKPDFPALSLSDESLFTALFHQYKHKLYAYLFAITKSEMLAEDIVQDIFLKLWNDRENLAGIDNFEGYLFRMSKNHAINHFRRMSHETLIVAEMFEADPPDNRTEETIALRDTEKVLHDIIAKLPQRQKMIYNLSRNDGLSHDEIAQLLNLSSNTVKNHIVLAVATIRTQLRYHSDTLLLLAFAVILNK